jgi:RNA polymerase sigma-70 factor (ECF subfamily)
MSKPALAKTDFKQLDDDELLSLVRAGNIDAFEGIMRHHNQRLFRIARGIVTDDAEAMDVVQESFVAAFEKLDSLKNAEALPLWLSRIVRNGALMRLRRSRRVDYMDEPEFDNVLSMTAPERSPAQPEARLANSELGRLLEACIDELPLPFRLVFLLRAVQQCSVSETAAILEINESTVKTRLHRARALLQERIMDYSANAGVAVHEFAGHRCDTVVANVLQKLQAVNRL